MINISVYTDAPPTGKPMKLTKYYPTRGDNRPENIDDAVPCIELTKDQAITMLFRLSRQINDLCRADKNCTRTAVMVDELM